MKKIVMMLSIASMLCVVLHGCKKESANFQNENANQQVNESKMIVGKINNFRERMNSNLKSSGTMTVDSAVWNLEALLNYDYAIPDSSAKDFTLIDSYYTLPLDENGLVSDQDMQTAFSQMTDTVDYQLSQIVSENKFLVLADVELIRIENHVAYISAHLGYGYNFVLGMYWPFISSDDWLWGTVNPAMPLAGKCDGTEIGVSDASNELRWRLNNPVVQPVNVYYTDLETLETEGSDFEDDNSNPRLYIGWNYPVDNCLTNDTLTYYLIQSHDIMYTYDYNGGLRPPTKSFMGVEIFDYLWMGNPPYHLHYYFVTYGIPHIHYEQ